MYYVVTVPALCPCDSIEQSQGASTEKYMIQITVQRALFARARSSNATVYKELFSADLNSPLPCPLLATVATSPYPINLICCIYLLSSQR